MAKAKVSSKAAPSKKAASKAKPAPAKKAITKKAPAATAKKAASKAKPAAKPAAKAVKKEPVAPKRNATSNSSSGPKTLDLCLLLDCTSSMYSWIQRSQETLCQIIDHVKSENKGLTVRVGFVAYRDINDRPRFDVTDFTEDVNLVKANVKK